MEKDDIIKTLKLEPHPEGGYYRRTYKNAQGPVTSTGENRGHASAIYYLCEGNTFSRWHRVDGDELWFWHAGSPLTLELRDDVGVRCLSLGPDLTAGQQPQHIVPAHVWQHAKSDGSWTLVSCAVSPGFLFETFEMEDD